MVKIYKDENANAVFIEDANGVQFLNSLQAITDVNNVNVIDLARNISLVSNTVYSDFINENSLPYGNTAVDVTNALNAMFSSTGTPTGELPEITSSLTAALTTGETLNYELTANFGVGYEWDFTNVSGITTISGNDRKIIGGTGLSAGTYNIPMKAINYNGEDSENLVLTVSNPPYNNTKSIRFNNNDYLDATANTSNPLYRSSNGSGASDAWSVCFWFKAGTNRDSEQTILMFGGSDQNNEGRVQIWYDGSNNDKHLRLRYGTNNNYLEFETPNNGVQSGVWNHFVITYDGGTTGQNQGNLNNYYNRFNIYKNGTNQSLSMSHNNYGWSGSVKDEYFRIGRNGTSGNYMRNNCLIDELSIFESDQTANISSIYNGGVTHDLGLLSTPPVSYWRMGDGDTYPTLIDVIAGVDFTMNNMTSADIVNDVP